MSKHNYYKCDCGSGDCMYCAGGLAYCEVCHGFEGTLPTECPGFPLNEYIRQAIYKGGLDFREDSWVVDIVCERCHIKFSPDFFIQSGFLSGKLCESCLQKLNKAIVYSPETRKYYVYDETYTDFIGIDIETYQQAEKVLNEYIKYLDQNKESQQ